MWSIKYGATIRSRDAMVCSYTTMKGMVESNPAPEIRARHEPYAMWVGHNYIDDLDETVPLILQVNLG